MIKFLDLVKKDTIITSEILPSVRELNSVDHAVRSDNIWDVWDWGSWGGAEVENFFARGDVNFVHTTEDSCSKLGPVIKKKMLLEYVC